jgi:ribosome biogenesis GTPase A
MLKKGGEVNEDRAARVVLKDWQAGKIKVDWFFIDSLARAKIKK